MKKFKVGDRVTAEGNIKEYFGASTIIEVDPNPNTLLSYLIDFDCIPGSRIWAYDETIERIPTQTIVIHQSGQTTKAVLKEGKETIRTAEARCSPDDTYDFEVGAKIAFERLMRDDPEQEAPVKLYCVKSYEPGEWLTKGKIYEIYKNDRIRFDSGCEVKWNDLAKPSSMTNPLFPLVERPAKVGEWVYADFTNPGLYRKGEVAKVVKIGTDKTVMMAGNTQYPSGRWIHDYRYYVLDGYTGEDNL